MLVKVTKPCANLAGSTAGSCSRSTVRHHPLSEDRRGTADIYRHVEDLVLQHAHELAPYEVRVQVGSGSKAHALKLSWKKPQWSAKTFGMSSTTSGIDKRTACIRAPFLSRCFAGTDRSHS